MTEYTLNPRSCPIKDLGIGGHISATRSILKATMVGALLPNLWLTPNIMPGKRLNGTETNLLTVG